MALRFKLSQADDQSRCGPGAPSAASSAGKRMAQTGTLGVGAQAAQTSTAAWRRAAPGPRRRAPARARMTKSVQGSGSARV